MGLLASVSGPLRARPAVVDAAVPALLAVPFLVVPLLLPGDLEAPDGRGAVDLTLTGADIALTVLSAAALTVRRRRPLLTLLLTAAAAAAAIAGGWEVNLAQLAVAVALFHYGLRSPRASTVVVTVLLATALGLLSVLMVVLGPSPWGRQDIVLWLCTAAALAVAVQSRRTTIAALEDRARRAEESREQTARRRVAEDRVRIARELHDVIAHHVAVISVQAGVAEHVLGADPAAARDAMSNVRVSAKDVLVELQQVLGVLRQDESELPTGPAPGLAGLADLVASFAASGTPVRLDTPHPVPQLSPAADVAAYRTVQEALTNVHKHAPGATTAVQVRPVGEAVEIVITNTPPARPATGTAPWTPADPGSSAAGDAGSGGGSGFGLLGMRERVTAAGGALHTGPTPDGGFRVAARVPLRAAS